MSKMNNERVPENTNTKRYEEQGLGLKEKIAHRYGLSGKGEKIFKRATTWSALAYLADLTPELILLMALVDITLPIENGSSFSMSAWKYVLAFIAAIFVMAVTQRRQYRATFCDTYEESGRRRIALAEKLRRLPLSFFGKKDLTELTGILMGDTETSEHAMSHALPQAWGAMAFCVICAVVLALIDWRLAIACLWVVPLALFIVFASHRSQNHQAKKMDDERRASAAAIRELIECSQEIRACNRQEAVIEQLQDQFERVEDLQGTYEASASVALTSARTVLQLGLPSTLAVGVMLYSSGSVSLPIILLFILLTTRMYDPVTEMLMNIMEIFASDVSNGRLAEVEHHPIAQGTCNFHPSRYDVSFDNVSFSYEHTPVLKGVNFVARQGEVTALVGKSGSGKTTVLKLAARLWDASTGTVKLDGRDVTSVDPETLLESYSEVFQDVVLFHGTVRDNIRLGKHGATDEEIESAAIAAQCDDFIARLPQGIDTELSENAATLSGGERQRISIARALLKNAPIVLLDEATASLDPESETRVQRAITELTQDKTVLMVAHRMRTVMHADHIVVLDEGRVVEDGTPKELLAQNGHFAELCRLQGIIA